MSPNPAFEQACREAGQLTKMPNQDEMLQLYALFKIGHGHDFSKAEAPGTFSIAIDKRYKYNAWKAEVEKGTTVEQAQEKYIQLVETLKEAYGFDPTKEPEIRT
jgi:diazepam-binding inhibitor (GABA receptor modulating acyl-CoA-binding protein)